MKYLNLLVDLKVKICSYDGLYSKGIIDSCDSKEGFIFVKKEDDGCITKFNVLYAFEKTLKFIDERDVPAEALTEIINKKKIEKWDNIYRSYIENEHVFDKYGQLKAIAHELRYRYSDSYVFDKYNEYIKSAYDELINDASIGYSNDQMTDALEKKAEAFCIEIMNDAKEHLYNKALTMDDYLNNTGIFKFPIELEEFVKNSDDIRIKILQKKKIVVKKIHEDFIAENYYSFKINTYNQQLENTQKEIINEFRHYIDENDPYMHLLKSLDEKARRYPAYHSHGFEGPVHVTELDNFVAIIKSGVMLSRDTLEKQGIIFNDKASPRAISVTQQWVRECNRFYYGFNTPTHFRADYSEPVGLVFNPVLFTWVNAIFLDRSAATSDDLKKYTLSEAAQFNWEWVFHRGPYDTSAYYGITQLRNTDFLIHGEVPISYIKKIYFPNEDIQNKARSILGNKLDSFEQEISLPRFT